MVGTPKEAAPACTTLHQENKKKREEKVAPFGIDKKEKPEVKEIYSISSFPVGLYINRKSMSRM